MTILNQIVIWVKWGIHINNTEEVTSWVVQIETIVIGTSILYFYSNALSFKVAHVVWAHKYFGTVEKNIHSKLSVFKKKIRVYSSDQKKTWHKKPKLCECHY